MRRTLTEIWFHDDAWWVIIDLNGCSTYTPGWSACGITRLTLKLTLISSSVHVFVQDWIDIMWFQTRLYCRPAVFVIFFIVQKFIFLRTASFYKQFLYNIGSMSRTLLQSIWYVWGHLKIVVDEKGAKRKNTRETYYDVKQRHNMAKINNTLTTIQFKKYIYLKNKAYWVHNLYINSSQTRCILIWYKIHTQMICITQSNIYHFEIMGRYRPLSPYEG